MYIILVYRIRRFDESIRKDKGIFTLKLEKKKTVKLLNRLSGNLDFLEISRC